MYYVRGGKLSISSFFFASFYEKVMFPIEKIFLRNHRYYLVEDISGSVLDLGCGTGLMFPYFKDISTDRSDISFFAIDPDSYMLNRSVEKAQKIDLDINTFLADGEVLPFQDNSFDFVIASLVFCTIPRLDLALSEISRILKPKGQLRFLEHIRTKNFMGIFLDFLALIW